MVKIKCTVWTSFIFGICCFAGLWLRTYNRNEFDESKLLEGGYNDLDHHRELPLPDDVMSKVVLGIITTLCAIFCYYKRIILRIMFPYEEGDTCQVKEDILCQRLSQKLVESLITNTCFVDELMKDSNEKITAIHENYIKLEEWISLNDNEMTAVVSSLDKRIGDLEKRMNRIDFEVLERIIQTMNTYVDSVPSSMSDNGSNFSGCNTYVNVKSSSSARVMESCENYHPSCESHRNTYLTLQYNSDSAIYVKPKDIQILNELTEVEKNINKARKKTKLHKTNKNQQQRYQRFSKTRGKSSDVSINDMKMSTSDKPSSRRRDNKPISRDAARSIKKVFK